MAANAHFLRKLAKDELFDSLFFATGQRPVQQRMLEYYTLKAGQFELKIHSTRKIFVNGDLCRSIPEAKYVICDLI